jgi:hypothetical protein
LEVLQNGMILITFIGFLEWIRISPVDLGFLSNNDYIGLWRILEVDWL